MRPRKCSSPVSTVVRLALALLLPVAGAVLLSTAVQADEQSWFVSFERINVAQGIKRNDVTQLIDAGSIKTDGFTELVFSFGGEFKEAVPSSGTLGAILLPDEEIIDYLLRNEGHFAFPLEVKFDVAGLNGHVFLSEQQTARIAFPRYRIYFYNETRSGATVSLYVYRVRR